MDGADLVDLFSPGRNSGIGCLVVRSNRNHNSREALLRRMSLLGTVGGRCLHLCLILLTKTSLSLVSREVPQGFKEYTIC